MNIGPGGICDSEVRMRSRSTKIFFIANVLLLAMAACQAPETPLIVTTQPPSELTLTALIQTLTAQPSAVLTETPTVPPTATYTPSPLVTMVSVSSVTNCRTGPSRYYKLVWKAEAGTTLEVVGKHESTNYWIVKLADGRECWLWGEYASVEGDLGSLPEYSPPEVGRIEGELRTSAAINAERISRADVSIGLPDFPPSRTGNDGKFVFEDVPIGEIKIDVKHEHHMFSNSIRVIVQTGQLSTVTILPIVPTDLTIPAPTSTGLCPIFQPNCQFLPTPGPAKP
jgi:hypothetical protein